MQDLLNSKESYVAYNAALSLNNKLIAQYKKNMLEDKKIIALAESLQAWPGTPLSSHKSANQLFHTLVFLADIGIKISDLNMRIVVDKILSITDEGGIPCLVSIIPEAYGGTGKEEKAWVLCDAPSVLYALRKLGCTDKKIDKAVKALSGLISSNAYGCHASKSLGSWRGPGKASDPCPYASLIMLKLLLQYEDLYHNEIKICAETLLNLWENSKTKHPYIFYMGTDFRKLKLPFIWYDILHVTEVLSQVKEVKNDPRLLEMLSVIESKNNNGDFIPESVYMAYKAWDFGQKKKTSDYLTYCILKIKNRLI